MFWGSSRNISLRDEFIRNSDDVREACRRTYARCAAFSQVTVNPLAFGDELGRTFVPDQLKFLSLEDESWVLIPAYEKRKQRTNDWHKCYFAARWREGRWRPSFFCLPPSLEVAETYLMEFRNRKSIDKDVVRVMTEGKTESSRDSMPVMDAETVAFLQEIEHLRVSGEWKRRP